MLIGSICLVLVTSLPCLTILRSDYVKWSQAHLEGQDSLQEQMGSLDGYSETPIQLSLDLPPLTFLSSGAFERVDPSLEFSRLEPPRLASRVSQGSWLRYFFPPLDGSALVVLLFSIIPYAFGYRSVCGEKQEGTLKLILVNPISRGKLILGKLMGLAAGLAGPFVIMMGLLLATVILTPSIHSRMDALQWFRLASFVGVAGVYSLLNLCAAVLFSTMASRPSNALLSLVGLWLGSAVIIPALGMEIAEYRVPSQPVTEHRHQIQDLNNAILREYEKTLQDIGYPKLHIPSEVLEKPGFKMFHVNLINPPGQVFLSRKGEFIAGSLADEMKKRVKAEIPALTRRQRRLYIEKESLSRDAKDRMLEQWESARLVEWISPSFLFAALTAEIVGSGPKTVAAQLDGFFHKAREFFGRLESSEEFRSDLFLSEGVALRRRTEFVPETGMLRVREPNMGEEAMKFTAMGGYLCGLVLMLVYAACWRARSYDPR